MLRRVISTAALVACAGVYAFAAAERVNFILTNGERHSGTVAAHGDQRENLINNYLNIATNDKDLTFPVDQVAVIDFVGGRPQPAELAQLGAGQMPVMRDGSVQQGRFVNMINGDTLVVGQRQRTAAAVRDPRRQPHLSEPDRARARSSITTRRSRPRRSRTSGQAITRQVRVDAKQAWTDTGITVNAGDHVSFNASGQIAFGTGPRPDRRSERQSPPSGAPTILTRAFPSAR